MPCKYHQLLLNQAKAHITDNIIIYDDYIGVWQTTGMGGRNPDKKNNHIELKEIEMRTQFNSDEYQTNPNMVANVKKLIVECSEDPTSFINKFHTMLKYLKSSNKKQKITPSN
ncbi:hypothetical protein OAB57_01035 [Bacteriovoracaceae bacterium]|nr:hypothetical protein [Bacteriovoracaceae bacterium]